MTSANVACLAQSEARQPPKLTVVGSIITRGLTIGDVWVYRLIELSIELSPKQAVAGLLLR